MKSPSLVNYYVCFTLIGAPHFLFRGRLTGEGGGGYQKIILINLLSPNSDFLGFPIQ